MKRSYANEIINDIYSALSKYNGVDVTYYRPTDDDCGFFEVSIDDEWCWDWVDGDIAWVLEKHQLEIDDESDEDFDLNAYWDE